VEQDNLFDEEKKYRTDPRDGGGYGERVPVADSNSDAGRAKNRRVEIMVYRESVGVGTPATAPSTQTR